VKFAFLFQRIQVLDVEETIDRQQGKEYGHDLSETEKAVVREMCNVSLMCFAVHSVLEASSQLSDSFKNVYFEIEDQIALHFFHENKTIVLVFIFSLFYYKDILLVMLKPTSQRDW
jgi:hypothetical protein